MQSKAAQLTQEQEQISPNHVQTIVSFPVHADLIKQQLAAKEQEDDSSLGTSQPGTSRYVFPVFDRIHWSLSSLFRCQTSI